VLPPELGELTRVAKPGGIDERALDFVSAREGGR